MIDPSKEEMKKVIEEVAKTFGNSPDPSYNMAADDFAIALCDKLGIPWIEESVKEKSVKDNIEEEKVKKIADKLIKQLKQIKPKK